MHSSTWVLSEVRRPPRSLAPPIVGDHGDRTARQVEALAPLVGVALDQPERRLHLDAHRGAEDLLHPPPPPLTSC